LKLNTKNNVAVFHPLAYMIRRLIYASIIVFMPETMTYLGTIILATISVLMAAYVIAERPWR